MQRVTIPRKLVMLGAGGLITIAGLGGVASHAAHAAHAASVHATAPAVQTAPASTDTDGAGGPDVQEQVGDQSTAADAAESAAPEAATETAASAATDAPGGVDVQSGPNDHLGPSPQSHLHLAWHYPW